MAAVQLADARPESSSSDEDDEVESDSESGDDEQKDYYYEDKYKEDDNYLGEDVFRVEAIRSTQRARTASPPLSTPIAAPLTALVFPLSSQSHAQPAAKRSTT